MNELYEELAVITTLPGKPRIRYARMLGLLRRICLQQSAGFKSDYSTLFSRLTAVCLENEIDHRPADRFRRHARLVLHEGKQPEREEEKADTADLAYFIFQITGENIPDSLPQAIRPLKIKSPLQRPSRNERAIVKEILTSDTFRCLLASDSLTYTVHIGLKGAELEENLNITSYLWKEANVMLLDIRPETNKQDALEASMVITEPDYLIDVSSLAACIKPYGVSPLNYLIDHFTPHKVNRYNLLGNLANSFMDDCVNNQTNSDDLFIMALKKNYQEAVLSFACLPDDEIDRTFFEKAKLHFNHIRETVNNRFSAKDIGLNADELVLEPSFICPILGLRGRLDVMTIDFHKVLELKSGRADEKGREDVHPRPEHLVQMALYGEILRRNFGIEWGGVKSFLFYSNYPTLINERIGWASVKSVLHLRNGILLSLKLLAQGHLIDLLPRLTPERLNQNHQDNRFYHQYLEPQLTKITNPLRMLERDSLIYLYFSAFLSFILREQFLAKTSDNRPDSVRGFASTWTTDVRTKLLAGNILTGLKIVAINETKEKGITSLRLSLPEYSEDFVPNFNKGEMVQIYLAEDERANVTNKQLIRAIVMEITAETITIEPTYPQRNPHVFPLDRTYNVEHDASDSPFHSQISGLYTLLTAPQRRRELILGRTRPKLDERVDLNGTYSPAVEKIVLQAKRACDYFLLVGPPGTGKPTLRFVLW